VDAFVQIHATSVVLNEAVRPFGGPEGYAVLLLGKSGSGKSDVALRLIAAGGKLISDDQTRLTSNGEFLFAEEEPTMAGFMEIRHVGIVKVENTPKAPVALVVELDPDAECERMPEPALYTPPEPLRASRLPVLLRLNPFEISTAAKIAAAGSAAFRGITSQMSHNKKTP
jgi:HPr kinase/phosphorylase